MINPYSYPIGKIEVNLIDIRDNMYDIAYLEEKKCIVNFRGREINGVFEPRAPLILECSLKEIVDLINSL